LLDNYIYLLLPVYIAVCYLYPELNVVILIFIGRLTFEHRLGIIGPLSLNHINFIILIIHAVMIYRFNKKIRMSFQQFTPYLVFIGILCLNSLFLSTNIDYAFNKIGSILLIVPISGYFLWMQYQKTRVNMIIRTLVAICIISIAMCLLGIVKIGSGEVVGRLAVMQGGPLSLARIAGLPIIILTSFLITNHLWTQRVYLLMTSIMLFVVQVWTLSKGPVLALFITLASLLLLYKQKKAFLKITALFLIFIAGVFATVNIFNLDDRFLMDPLSSRPDNTYKLRWELYVVSIEQFAENSILGLGLGDFTEKSIINDITYKYPHNLILEILAETGAVGWLFFMMLFTISIRRIILYYGIESGRDAYLQNILTALLIYTFVNQMFSGDLTSLRFFLLFLILSDFNTGYVIRSQSPARSEIL